ncbi:MAG: hypothetical protein KME45_28080 [Stenomitos rutilans HA7619-LM2]|jgi:hypothetical protein|nr:hypothetical protein [Stenomitos rutilans HA7619-LM2]
MSYFFSQASLAVEVFSIGYLASAFAVHTHRRMSQVPGWRTYQAAQASQHQVTVPEPGSSTKRKLSPVEQLRQQCQEAGIKWRNAHGKNKHLKKAEMLSALQQLEQSRRLEEKKRAKTVPTAPATSPKRAA